MNKKIVTALSILFMALTQTQLANAESFTQPATQSVHVTVVNNSDVSLEPAAEGVSQGCVGGGLPPFFIPVAPHTTRQIDLVFLQYLPSCQFNVLPEPQILTYLQACHSVKADDTVTFTGHDYRGLRCDIG